MWGRSVFPAVSCEGMNSTTFALLATQRALSRAGVAVAVVVAFSMLVPPVPHPTPAMTTRELTRITVVRIARQFIAAP